MPTDPPLVPATDDAVLHTLLYGLRYRRNGKSYRHDRQEDEIVAWRLLEALRMSQFVIMQRDYPPIGPAAKG